MKAAVASRARIGLANSSLRGCPGVGGRGFCFVQSYIGLPAVGHDVCSIGILHSTGDREWLQQHGWERVPPGGVRREADQHLRLWPVR